MATEKLQQLGELAAALGEFVDRLGLTEPDKAALIAEVDAIRSALVYGGAPEDLTLRLRAVRGILQSSGENRLAGAALAEIDSILGD